MRCVYSLLLVCLLCASSTVFALPGWQQKAQHPDYLHRSIKMITDVMVHDIYSPPVASRTYAYITVAAYEAAILDQPRYVSLAGQLHDLEPFKNPYPENTYSAALASVHAVLTLGKSFVITEDKIKAFHKQILSEYKAMGIPEPVYKNSLVLGEKIASHILAWSSSDNYKETRSFPKYSVDDEENTWKPTPPSYMRAVEPHWGSIRTFVIDSAQQFKPLPPTTFSIEKNSTFYKEAAEVYEAGIKLTPEQIAIANFWDCNPFKMNVKGHVMFATKKISPGGHWINITRLASRKASADFMQSAEAYASVAIAMADGFISCWDEKYRSNVVRPETYINQYIDNAWTPLLQTPPFPEYTSGHSVISSAAARILTNLFGKDFSFADSTEVEFGLQVRSFNSFEQAASEAAISRFFGGIHYMPSITRGLQEGQELSSFIRQKLKTRKEEIAVL